MASHSIAPPRAARSEDEMLLDVHRSKRRSVYVLSNGASSTEYTDFDGYYLGGVGDHEFSKDLAQQRLVELIQKVVPNIGEAARKHSIARLAFYEKRDDGPVGMLTHMNLIAVICGIESCIIRPEKRLLAASIKGRPIVPGERFMIVSDVATSGHTILRVATRIREVGGIVPAAFVLYDRCSGAKQHLAEEGIALESFWTQKNCDDLVGQLTVARTH